MHTKEKQLLDLNQNYPCPSCKQGVLVPITLTEAWGCDRCKQIFELKPQPNTVGKLSTPYPRQRTWHWNGERWQLNSNRLKSAAAEPYLLVRVIALAVVLWLTWVLLQAVGLAVAFKIALIVLALVVMFWLVLRR